MTLCRELGGGHRTTWHLPVISTAQLSANSCLEKQSFYYSDLKKALSINKPANIVSEILAVIKAALVPTFNTT